MIRRDFLCFRGEFLPLSLSFQFGDYLSIYLSICVCMYVSIFLCGWVRTSVMMVKWESLDIALILVLTLAGAILTVFQRSHEERSNGVDRRGVIFRKSSLSLNTSRIHYGCCKALLLPSECITYLPSYLLSITSYLPHSDTKTNPHRT